MRRRLSAAVSAVALAVPVAAAAQQAPAGWDRPPHPTDAGKPLIYDPEFAAKADKDLQFGCTPGLQCRLRLLGVIQNNGAVELRTTVHRW
jgi:hypothetical protein